MNENAGLMTDLILLSQKRPPLDTERIQSITERITGQIKRADTILKNLNVFSHSMDKAVQPVDLCEAIGLAAELGRRICENRRVTVHTPDLENPVGITAPFFFVLYLIWMIVEHAVHALPSGSILDITVIEKQGCPTILFSSEAPFGSQVEQALADSTAQHLLALTTAKVAVDSNIQCVELYFRSSPADA